MLDAAVIEPFGELVFSSKENEWFGRVKNIFTSNEVELTLCVENAEQSLIEKIEITRTFVNAIDLVMAELYEFIHKKYFLNFGKTIEEVRQMYFLAAITLRNDNQTWWLVLEPSVDVETIHNHFLRFTLINKEIVWNNFTQRG